MVRLENIGQLKMICTKDFNLGKKVMEIKIIKKKL